MGLSHGLQYFPKTSTKAKSMFAAAAGATIGSRRPATHLQFVFHLQRFKLGKVSRQCLPPRRAACTEFRRLAGIGCTSGAIEASAHPALASNLAANLQHGDHED